MKPLVREGGFEYLADDGIIVDDQCLQRAGLKGYHQYSPVIRTGHSVQVERPVDISLLLNGDARFFGSNFPCFCSAEADCGFPEGTSGIVPFLC